MFFLSDLLVGMELTSHRAVPDHRSPEHLARWAELRVWQSRCTARGGRAIVTLKAVVVNELTRGGRESYGGRPELGDVDSSRVARCSSGHAIGGANGPSRKISDLTHSRCSLGNTAVRSRSTASIEIQREGAALVALTGWR